MKRILLLLAGGMLASGLHAGEIKLYSENSLLEPGTHYFNNLKVEDEGDYVTVTIDPKLSIKSDTRTFDVQVTARCTSGQKIQMCAGGQCVKNTEVVKSGLILNADVALDLQFEFMDDFDSVNDVPKNITTELTVEELGVATSKKLYTIVMNDPTGSVDVVAHEAEVYFLNGSLNYSLSGEAAINVYDVNGRLVKSASVNGNGSFGLSDLAKGIYLYSVSGSADTSGKVIL